MQTVSVGGEQQRERHGEHVQGGRGVCVGLVSPGANEPLHESEGNVGCSCGILWDSNIWSDIKESNRS